MIDFLPSQWGRDWPHSPLDWQIVSLEPRMVKPGGQVNRARPPTSRLTIETRKILSAVTFVISEQRTLSQKGIGAFHVPDGRQVSSGAPIRALLFWQVKKTLVPILVFRFEATNPLRSGICGQCTG